MGESIAQDAENSPAIAIFAGLWYDETDKPENLNKGEKIMPHSSGGGSSGGGSHGGSHGGKNAHYVSHRPSPGAHPYLYYYHGAPRVIYADVDVTSPAYRKEKIIEAAIGGFILLILLFIAFLTCRPASKITPAPNTEPMVSDNLSVIGNTADLQTKLVEFEDLTGIVVVAMTVDSGEISSTQSLEDYAYDTYVKRFPGNEKVWLFVYTEDFRGNDWAFEGMQGYETDDILSEAVTTRVNKVVTRWLDGEADFGEALSYALSDAMARNLMGWRFPVGELLFMGFFALVLLICTVLPFFEMLHIQRGGGNRVNLKEDDDVKKMELVLCDYCRKKYIKGLHKVCPFCKTPPPAFRGTYNS